MRANKFVSILLVSSVFATLTFTQVQSAEAFWGQAAKAVGKVAIGVAAYVGATIASEKIAEAGEKKEALEYMCTHPCGWRDRHPEWDIYEKDLMEMIEVGACEKCFK